MTIYNKPYKWGVMNVYPEKLELDYKWRERKTDNFTFMWCIHLPGDSGSPHVTYTLQDPSEYDLILHVRGEEEKLLKYDCLQNNMGGRPPIVNQRVLAILNDMCPNDFQAFPVEIHNENPKLPDFVNRDYVLINLVNEIDVFDHKHSIFETFESGHISKIIEAVFRENCMAGHHIGRLKGYHSFIVVSPELVARFKCEKIKGVTFRTDEEYSMISNPGRETR